MVRKLTYDDVQIVPKLSNIKHRKDCKTITRVTKNVWTRIFPNIPVSKKPIEVRMGKGKGNPEFFACRVKPGRILFEVDGVSEQIAKEALYKASAKLPIKTKTIKRFA